MPVVKSCGQMAPSYKCNARTSRVRCGGSPLLDSCSRERKKGKERKETARREKERKKENSFEKETVTDADG